MNTWRKKHWIIVSSFAILVMAFVFSADFMLQTNALSEVIQTKILEKFDSSSAVSISGTRIYDVAEIRAYYQSIGYKGLWVNNEPIGTNTEALMHMLDQADKDGLIVRDYHRDVLKHKIFLSDQWVAMKQADSLAELDMLLTDACLNYAIDISIGQLYSADANANRDDNIKSMHLEVGLKNALDSQKLNSWLLTLPPHSCTYRELKEDLATYTSIYAKGGFVKLDDSIMNARMGNSGREVLKLRQYLTRTGDIYSSVQDSIVFDSTLEKGIRNFQERFGLHKTDHVDIYTLHAMNTPVEQTMAHIMGSMERLRWLPANLGQKYVLVNITDYSLQVVENYSTQLKMRVIVGKPYKQTPIFQAEMKHVVINPYWEVPWSIMTEEMIPKLVKNRNYLAQNHMKLFDQKGVEISSDTVHWDKVVPEKCKFIVKQTPGTWNSLGRIKFLFPNPYQVYLHGTPDQYLFAKDIRTFSHGCMRVEDPLALAVCILKSQGLDKKEIKKQMEGETETIVDLKKDIPVHITYLTAWIDGNDQICFRDDIYNRDAVFLDYIKGHQDNSSI